MSMSQEEIEALMAQNDFSASDTDENDTNNNDNENNENIDELLNEVIGDTSQENPDSSDSNEKDDKENTLDEDNLDEILSGIDGIVDEEETKPDESKNEVESSNEIKDVEQKIEEGVYPLPVTKEHKVVSQLSQVAEDSEEKASQIFDVLSFILDENNLVQNKIEEIKNHINSQISLLEKLSQKFPKIEVFNSSLQDAKVQIANISEIENYLNEENSKVFEAMELMQFHDINRQKIERVMAVIKKLNDYLNGLFEDDYHKPEVKIAKHISGDSNETVSEEDLDALINQFSKGD